MSLINRKVSEFTGKIYAYARIIFADHTIKSFKHMLITFTREVSNKNG